MKEALEELLPRKARLVLYIIATLVLWGISAYQAAQGDWLEFAVILATSFAPVLAAGNVNKPAPIVEAAAPFSVTDLVNAINLPENKAALERRGYLVGQVVPPEPPGTPNPFPTQREPFDDWDETRG